MPRGYKSDGTFAGRVYQKGHKLTMGKKSGHWKGCEVGYIALHEWLSNYYGKANKCENPKCQYKNPKRYEWALIKGKKYERKRENFWRLCVSCHRKYDATEEREYNRLKGFNKNKYKWVKKYIFNGQAKSLPEWAREYGLNENLLRVRIRILKWSIQDALMIKPKIGNNWTLRKKI